MIFIAGITLAIFIEILLISKRNKSDPDKLLILWMFLIALHIFFTYMFQSGEYIKYPFILGIEMPFPLLHGVFLYLYVGSMTGQLPEKRVFLFIHFVPVTLAYMYLFPFIFSPAEYKIQVYRNQGAGYEVFMKIRYIAIVVSGILYVTWSLLLLRKHRRNILDRFSDVEKINLQWLRILTWGLGGIWIMVIFLGNDTYIFEGVVVFVFLIAFFGIRQVGIFSNAPGDGVEESQKEKYSKSGLSADTSEKLYNSLMQLMEKETVYRNNELSVNDLAARLEVHPNYISQVINEREGKNFYDFINNYRIEEFKRLIAKPENRRLTLLALAFDCGFNSKSSFNRHFKKITGQTPSEYYSNLG